MSTFTKLKRIYSELELRVQVYAIVYSVSSLLSLIGLVLGVLFQMPFWMNIPHIFTIIMCLVIPVIFRKDTFRTFTVVVSYVAILYLPFVLFTNGGAEGAGTIYLMMIIVFYAFHFGGKQLALAVVGLNLYFMALIVLTHFNPSLAVPYPDEVSHVIDLSVAVVAVSSVLVTISYTSFSSYKKERKNVFQLMEALKEKNELLEDLAVRDQLTGVFSRKYLLDRLEEGIASKGEAGIGFSVLMVDIDRFKRINDSYGHLFGDEVIRQVAKVLQAHTSGKDVAARYGGEEFILFLPQTDKKAAFEAADIIRSGVEAIVFRDEVHVTVSIGVSGYQVGDTVDTLIDRADKALYRAKNSGRNSVCTG